MSTLANIGLRTKLIGAFGLVMIVLVILASAAYRTTVLNQEASDAVAHTFEVIGTANAALADLVDMETSYRGFLLAGDDAFLEPYNTGDADVGKQLARLRELTADNPRQIERWDAIERQLQEWRQVVTEPGIALRRQFSAGQVTQEELNRYVASGEGRRRFEVMRRTLDEALTSEERLLIERQAEATNRRERLLLLLASGTALAVGLGVVLALVLSADLAGPVSRLALTAREIADGQLDRRIGLKRGDEIGVAAAAFDQMADRLGSTIVQSQAILTTAAEAILGLDRTGRVTFANPAAARMLGVPADDLIEQPAGPWLEPAPVPLAQHDLAPPDALPAATVVGPMLVVVSPGAASAVLPVPGPVGGDALIAAVIDRGVAEEGAGELVRPVDGNRLPIEYACAPIQAGGVVTGAVLTFRDVTERRAAQQTLEERNRELARSNADLEQFAYVASHDLQEPLRAVVSYLQLLERRYGGQLDERAEKYIGYAVDGGRRMQTLISDLLTYSRVGRRDIALAPVEMDTVVDRALASLQVALEESGAVVTRDPLPMVVADATQMTQLLQNLVGNAVKFRGEAPPRIHISAQRQQGSGADVQHGAWLFSVRDNGIGIAPEYRERVFVLFQRLHGRDEYSGTGIGLAVCKRIVERHGGTLWVDDTPGGGSTFWFTIPAPGDDSA
jgi:signal transduction histidine kinase/CHASE3 domain sensor protein